jgi:hypothetical protein
MQLGFSAQESVLGVSAFSIAFSMVMPAIFLGWCFRHMFMFFLTLFVLMHSSESWAFGMSGGSDALGLCLFMLAVCALKTHEMQGFKAWCTVLSLLVLGAMVRPQNQIFLLLLPVWLVLMVWEHRKESEKDGIFRIWSYVGSWLLAILIWKLIQRISLQGHQLTFPYSFSFLVGTPPYPGHDLFREYFSEGFGLMQVWEQRMWWMAKLELGFGVLKQYWNTWLPPLLAFGIATCFKKTRPLGALMMLTFLTLVMLSITGHLVPRYWTFFQGPAALVGMMLLGELWLRLKDLLCRGKMAMGHGVSRMVGYVVVGVTAMTLVPEEAMKKQAHRKLNLLGPPQEIVSELRGPWLASDRPNLVVDVYDDPILFLPNDPQTLDRLSKGVQSLEQLLFTPVLKSGELSHWEGRKGELLSLGYRLALASEGWELWERTQPN